MADQKVNELSTATPALTDYIMGMGSSAEYKALVSAVAKKIVEDYAGSSLAGSNQSIKAALDGLNSNLATTYFAKTSGNINTSNIDGFTTAGIYSGYIEVIGILGLSSSNSYGLLIVSCPPNAQRIGQYILAPSAGVLAMRYYGGSSWTAWKKVALT